MSDPAARKVSVGFWRHVPWAFTVGVIVSFGLSIWISAYFNSYAGSIVAIWVSLLYPPFKESKEKERERIRNGDAHPIHHSSTSWIEISLAGALVAFCVGFAVITAYIRIGDDQRVPTQAQGLLAGTAHVPRCRVLGGPFRLGEKKEHQESTRGELIDTTQRSPVRTIDRGLDPATGLDQADADAPCGPRPSRP